MKFLFIFSGLLFQVGTFETVAQCRIAGTIHSMESGQVFLIDAQSRDTLDAGEINAHHFQLHASLVEDTSVARPAMLLCLARDRRASQTLPVALENDIIHIDIDSFGVVRYSGTKAQDDFNGFLVRTMELTSGLMQNSTYIQDSMANALGVALERFYHETSRSKLGLFVSMLITDMINRRFIDPTSMPDLFSSCQHPDQIGTQDQRICEAMKAYASDWSHVPLVSFTGRLPGNKMLSIDSIIGTKPVILDFWASWCGPCIREMPSLKDLYAEGKVEIIGISIDASENAWIKSLDKLQLPWINVWDKGSQIAKRYNVTAVPTKFVIDKNGTIIVRNPEDLDALLASLRE